MAPAESTGRVVAGRYELLSLLGRGGMGQVWLAHDAVLHREVAVKEVAFPAAVSESEHRELHDRTMREARAAARFEHPRVTTVHDVVEQDGQPWIVMEHVPSRSLADLVQDNGPLPVARVARIGLDVLEALGAAHRMGIVHRDVKPANVLVSSEGRAWLTDFGIASSAGESRMTGHGVVLGSPSYIAPERAQGEAAGAAVDLWGLGATLYYAVEGRPPFDRGEGMATLLAITTEQPPRPEAAGPLEQVLVALLSRDPARRATREQTQRALQDVLDSGAATRRLPAAGRGAPSVAPAPAPAPPTGVPAGRRSGSGHAAERIDVEELAGLAAAATKAVAGSAARRMARRSQRPAPAPAARPPAPPARRDRAWRFKRRWVVVPVVVVGVLTVVLLLSLLGAALEVFSGYDD